MILGLAGGQTLAAVSRSQGCSVNTVKLWRDRFVKDVFGLGTHRARLWLRARTAGSRIIDWTLHRKPAEVPPLEFRKLAANGFSNESGSGVDKAGLQPPTRHYMAARPFRVQGGRLMVSTEAADPRGRLLVDERAPFRLSIAGSGFACRGRRRHGLIFPAWHSSSTPLWRFPAASAGQNPAHTSASSSPFWRWCTQPAGRNPRIADNLSAHKTRRESSRVINVHSIHPTTLLAQSVEIWFSKIQRDLITRGIFTQSRSTARSLAISKSTTKRQALNGLPKTNRRIR